MITFNVTHMFAFLQLVEANMYVHKKNVYIKVQMHWLKMYTVNSHFNMLVREL